MGDLTGKKVLCFLALPHHNRFLVPIMEALQGRGMEVIYFTVPAEGAFEITLNQANLPYRHILDYADAVAAEKSEIGYREIRDIYDNYDFDTEILAASIRSDWSPKVMASPSYCCRPTPITTSTAGFSSKTRAMPRHPCRRFRLPR
jgi:hypothetical protein